MRSCLYEMTGAGLIISRSLRYVSVGIDSMGTACLRRSLVSHSTEEMPYIHGGSHPSSLGAMCCPAQRIIPLALQVIGEQMKSTPASSGRCFCNVISPLIPSRRFWQTVLLRYLCQTGRLSSSLRQSRPLSCSCRSSFSCQQFCLLTSLSSSRRSLRMLEDL